MQTGYGGADLPFAGGDRYLAMLQNHILLYHHFQKIASGRAEIF